MRCCKNETKHKKCACHVAMPRECLTKSVVLVLMEGLFYLLRRTISHMRSPNRAQSYIHLLMLVCEYMHNSFLCLGNCVFKTFMYSRYSLSLSANTRYIVSILCSQTQDICKNLQYYPFYIYTIFLSETLTVINTCSLQKFIE